MEVQVNVHFQGGIIVEPTLLTFTPESWIEPQIVRVVAIDDWIEEQEMADNIHNPRKKSENSCHCFKFAHLATTAILSQLEINLLIEQPSEG